MWKMIRGFLVHTDSRRVSVIIASNNLRLMDCTAKSSLPLSAVRILLEPQAAQAWGRRQRCGWTTLVACSGHARNWLGLSGPRIYLLCLRSRDDPSPGGAPTLGGVDFGRSQQSVCCGPVARGVLLAVVTQPIMPVDADIRATASGS